MSMSRALAIGMTLGGDGFGVRETVKGTKTHFILNEAVLKSFPMKIDGDIAKKELLSKEDERGSEQSL
jgi:hypothetical protein